MRLFGIADSSLVESAPARSKPLRKIENVDNKARWYLPSALLIDGFGAALPVGAVFSATGQARPLACAVAAAVGWVGVAALRRRYAPWHLGESGAFTPVVRDWLTLVGVLAVLHVMVGAPTPPAAAVAGLAPCVLITVVRRKAVHRHLIATRKEANAVRRVLVIGEADAADEVAGHLARRTDHEFVVVGICAVGEGDSESGAPVRARLSAKTPGSIHEDSAAVLGAAEELRADVVFVTPGRHLSGERLRWLSWALHETGHPLAVLPGLTEVSRRRVQLTSAAGLSLMHIAPPSRRGLPQALKEATDKMGSVALLAVLAPLFGALALAVRLGSPGPVFHRQIRIGRDRTAFRMWKFRTMVEDAERHKDALESANENDGHMFKMRQDPRVTRVGRFLRRYSLDELPQLVNVLKGDMSLVGPRPPLPEEVARYSEVEVRRLSVKPGLTGLWQVSGRSDLSWDETVALDLRYVDNWSYGRDWDVLVRTLRAVADGRGAY